MNWKWPNFLQRKVKDSPYKTLLLDAMLTLSERYVKGTIKHSIVDCPLCIVCTDGAYNTGYPIVNCSMCPNMAFHDKRTDIPHDWDHGMVERPCVQRFKPYPKLDYTNEANNLRLATFWTKVNAHMAGLQSTKLYAYNPGLCVDIHQIALEVCEE